MLTAADFPFAFAHDQRALAQRFVDNRQVTLLQSGDAGMWRASVRIFKRTVEAWAEKHPQTGAFSSDCECPHRENTGEGCAHLYALLLAAAAPPAAHDDEEDLPTLEPLWIVDRERSHGRRTLWITPYLRRDGAGDLQQLAITSVFISRVLGDDDRIVNLLALGAGGRLPLDRGGGFAKPDGPFALDDDALVEALPILVRTGRLLLDGSSESLKLPVVMDADAGFDTVMALSPKPAKPGVLVLRGQMERGAEILPAQSIELVSTGRRPFLIHRGHAAWLNMHDAGEWLKFLLKKDGPEVPADDVDAFLERLSVGGALPRLRLPGVGLLPVLEGEPEPILAITRDRRETHGTLGFLYAGRTIPAVGQDVLMLDAPGRRQIKRNATREAARAAEIVAAGGTEDEDVFGRFLLGQVDLVTFAGRLIAGGFAVRVDGRAQRVAGAKRLSLKSGLDWFEATGEVAFGDETIPLTVVLEAVGRGKTSVLLKDGSEALLPVEWAAGWRLLAELGEKKGQGYRFARAQAPALDILLADRAGEWQASPEDMAALRAGLDALRSPPAVEPPAALRGELRPYQRAGLAWLSALDDAGFGGCLADDMGLGKTVQVIALLLRHRARPGAGPALVVVPRSLVFNWLAELERFAPSLRVLAHADLERDERNARLTDCDVVITTYGIVRRDSEILAKTTFDWVILDESQAIKNSTSQNAQCVARLTAKRRLVMTGTPIENRPEELWSQFQFLNPGLLGKEADFGRLARQAETRGVIARIVRPLILRRAKREVAPDLPERIEQVVTVDLPPEQAAVYRDVLARAQTDVTARLERDGIGAARLHVLTALLRLRQAACHPALIDAAYADVPSAKLDVLMERLQQVVDSGQKALVFSQFTGLLALVRARLDTAGLKHVYLDGSTRDRAAPVRAFQEDEATPIFLVSLMAGGHGLNLTRADYVIILDPWWNPAVEAQAIDRAHRIGRMGAVVALRLVARNTVEEKMLELQTRKKDLANALLAADDTSVGALTVEDLLLLFG